MAKNTGRGSRHATTGSDSSGVFAEAKRHGGSFRGVRHKPWWKRLLCA